MIIHDTFHDDIECVLWQQCLRTSGRQPAPAEFNAWKHALFLKKEANQRKAFIRQHVRHGGKRSLLYPIEHGKIRPSKMLADTDTIKRYRNENVVDADGSWRHERVGLVPESNRDGVDVIAEWLMVVERAWPQD